MAAQMELAELKKAVEELGHKMDKQMIMVQGLVGLFTSTAQQSDMGLLKEPSQAYHPPTVGIKLCSGDMFKDLAEFHEARTYPKEDVGSLFTTIAEGEDTLRDDFYPEGKRMHPIDEDMCCNCKANKGPALNSQLTRRNSPRAFSCFTAPLVSVYEKLLEAGSIKPLNPTPLPKNPPANFKYNLYCTYHQTPGHSTNACFRLRHAIQDLMTVASSQPHLHQKSILFPNAFLSSTLARKLLFPEEHCARSDKLEEFNDAWSHQVTSRVDPEIKKSQNPSYRVPKVEAQKALGLSLCTKTTTVAFCQAQMRKCTKRPGVRYSQPKYFGSFVIKAVVSGAAAKDR
ncbi:hypothetical protein RHMOL_Rhmol01G0182900 [Rhododendron molle]|uniref:Uncharacterized protein n=1 Tax=Rhododendron molle TaxID=49168 RepID=A0ACC0Q3F1_RHOML|nr:hypothetical protein RHMOL_Rhmol01G0182900 [Rhododendron molle]